MQRKVVKTSVLSTEETKQHASESNIFFLFKGRRCFGAEDRKTILDNWRKIKRDGERHIFQEISVTKLNSKGIKTDILNHCNFFDDNA